MQIVARVATTVMVGLVVWFIYHAITMDADPQGIEISKYVLLVGSIWVLINLVGPPYLAIWMTYSLGAAGSAGLVATHYAGNTVVQTSFAVAAVVMIATFGVLTIKEAKSPDRSLGGSGFEVALAGLLALMSNLVLLIFLPAPTLHPQDFEVSLGVFNLFVVFPFWCFVTISIATALER